MPGQGVEIRRADPGDVAGVRALCRTVQKAAAREEIGIHLCSFLVHPFFAMLMLLTFSVLQWRLQTPLELTACAALLLVGAEEGLRFWLFWRRLRHVFGEGADLRDLGPFYSHPRRFFLVAVINNEVAGTVAARETDSFTSAKLWRMFVHPRFRKMGLASRLISACHEECARLGYTSVVLRTHVTNFKARKCYEKAGYVCTGKNNFARLYPHSFDVVHYLFNICDTKVMDKQIN
ncbi:uncharacterized protein LOC125044251 [Penaeus chinensis]|uniref:uncharacterized protein LOC125044251 n=1 Tax=Penaeus chinensis TaxID=139456 RepID=UPI001FB66B73|nr:uncharacterized protein LOC125044251 [Penaeus chinensis]XP_047496881.1 uncharacterized protein LOC125044251 [Penaeus chinensis]